MGRREQCNFSEQRKHQRSFVVFFVVRHSVAHSATSPPGVNAFKNTPTDIDHHSFFSTLGFDILVQEARRAPEQELAAGSAPLLPPDLSDLRSLYSLIQATGRTTVLEFGCGWSSLVMAASLASLNSQIGDLANVRRSNLFQYHSVDNMEQYIEIARAKIPQRLKEFVQFHTVICTGE